ncbi:GIY-YIG nuclease family protein [Mycetocola sp. 2940]|uniref:GIY-YIG nuclease family protein n=1 Tax=Mycetocola sp. 2940 TaxID=3156452 RepID=UPI003396CBF5
MVNRSPRAETCAVLGDGGEPCSGAVDAGSPLNLCVRHLQVAHDWVDRDSGVTDVLPTPCLACGSRLGVRYPSGWLCAVCEWKLGDIPDGETVAPRVDVVYYLRFRDRIKIGTSVNPRQRFAGIRHDEVLAFERGNRLTEQKRHAQFAAHRLDGSEWFSAHEDILAHIETLRAGIDDPWAQYALWRSQQAALDG